MEEWSHIMCLSTRKITCDFLILIWEEKWNIAVFEKRGNELFNHMKNFN